jgi:cytochrome P450
MSTQTVAPPSAPQPQAPLLAEAAPSPAGPAGPDAAIRIPPALPMAPWLQTLRFSVRQIELVFRARRELGDVFRFRGAIGRGDVTVITSHPDHVRSLFTAKPEQVPSLTGQSPLRPIVGPNSVLTAIGPRHMRQRKLLLPPFHGEAVQRYVDMIDVAAHREIDRWPVGEPFALAPRMQAITLDVIMGGIFGVEGRPERGTPEHGLRRAVRRVLDTSTRPEAQLGELINLGRDEPVGPTKAFIGYLDRHVYRVIEARRAAADTSGNDILSILLQAETEDGERLTDKELRDELLTLVLAGHETTANQLAWTFERLLRTPAPYDRLRDVVRGGDGEEADAWIEATIHEGMRNRPVIPIIGRMVTEPWRLGEYVVPAETWVLMSILLVHHRDDVYPDPFSFRPERFEGQKPGTYAWIPFGGGIRRCLGATLAMAEQRSVLRAIAARTDLVAPDPEPEHARHRNVTMIPAKGGQVVVTSKRPA